MSTEDCGAGNHAFLDGPGDGRFGKHTLSQMRARGELPDESILFIARDGASWTEKQTVSMTSLEGPPPEERIISIQDGSDLPRPWLVYVLPDRKP